MSNSSADNNVGCLGCLGILLALVAGFIYLGYEFYNCSVNRPISTEAVNKLSMRGFIARGDLPYLEVSTVNNTDWIIHNISIRLILQKKNGEKIECTGSLKSFGTEKLEIYPAESSSYLVLKLSDGAQESIKSGLVEDWNFQLVEVTGRRKPIRLVKNIKESFAESMTKIKGLFEREK